MKLSKNICFCWPNILILAFCLLSPTSGAAHETQDQEMADSSDSFSSFVYGTLIGSDPPKKSSGWTRRRTPTQSQLKRMGKPSNSQGLLSQGTFNYNTAQKDQLLNTKFALFSQGVDAKSLLVSKKLEAISRLMEQLTRLGISKFELMKVLLKHKTKLIDIKLSVLENILQEKANKAAGVANSLKGLSGSLENGNLNGLSGSLGNGNLNGLSGSLGNGNLNGLSGSLGNGNLNGWSPSAVSTNNVLQSPSPVMDIMDITYPVHQQHHQQHHEQQQPHNYQAHDYEY